MRSLPFVRVKAHLALAICLICLGCCIPLSASDFYAAPGGSAAGNGSITNPWDLQTALSQPSSVHPGDTIWLRGGTYVGAFTSVLTGTAGNPIIVRQFPGERATLDIQTPNSQINTGLHTLNVVGPYAWYWGFEVMNSNTTREANTVLQSFRGDGVWVTGANTKFINLIVHDTDQGFSFWTPAVDSDLYGNLIYNNGWMDPSRGRGHGVYMQNLNGTKKLLDNLLFAGFQYGFQAYGSDAAQLDNFYLEGNSAAFSGILQGSFARNILIGGHSVAHNPVLVSNYTYVDGTGGDNNLGYAAGCTNPVVTNNYMAGALRFVTCSNVTMSGNTFWGLVDWVGTTYGQSKASFPNNTYFPTTPPPGIKIFVRPNLYETGRANITIFNWTHSSTVAADISGIGLQIGDSYELHNAEDYYGDVINGVWNGGTIQIPMTGHTVAAPVGWPASRSTYPEFGMFVIQKASGAAAGPQAPAVPVITPGGGAFSGSVTVAISSGTPGATIRYTTDGSTPGPTSAPYQNPFTISSTTTVQAQAFLAGAPPSAIASTTFTQSSAAAPGISPGGGSFSNSVTVLLTSTTAGAVIHYTLDGSSPNSSSPVYNAALVLTANTVVRALASAPGIADSTISSATFTISAGPGNPPEAAVPQAGLKMWLRADAGITAAGSAVSQWADQSGSGASAFQPSAANRPSLAPNAINGLPAIHFDGTSSFMTFVLPLNNLNGMTVLMLSGKLPDVDGAWNGVANAPLFWDELVSWCSTNFSPFRGMVKYRFGTGQSLNLPAYTRPQPLGPNDYTLTTAIKNGSVEQLFVGGQLVFTETGKIPTLQGVVDTGTLGRGMLTYYQGDIAEVLVYNRALSDAERQLAEAYLLNKYLGVSAPLPPPAGGTTSLWPNSATPAVVSNAEGNPVELGVKFRSDVAGYITGIRFYKGSLDTGTHTGQLWSSTGTLMGQGVFAGETPSGWQQVNFATPVAIAPNTTYVAAYHTTSGHFPWDRNYFATVGVDSAPLHGLKSGVDGGNGVYLYNATPGFPSLTYGATNYWVDVVFSQNTLPPALATITANSGVAGTIVPLTLTGTNLTGATLNLPSGLTANNVVAVATQISANLAIAGSAPTGPQNITVTTPTGGTSGPVVFTINPPQPTLTAVAPNSGAVGSTVPVTLTGANLTGATLNLSAGLTVTNVVANATQITANLVIAANAGIGPQNITATTAGGASSAVVFTNTMAVAGPPPANGTTIWPSSASPSVLVNSEGNPVELGVKFRSDVAGFITGIRFYRTLLDTGIHTGQLWTSTGSLLAQGVFSGESASGWQQLNFATPVAIAANTTYIAAYHTTAGHFAFDRNYFALTGANNAPLHALQSGVDGGNGVYLYSATPGLPVLSFGASNYWVDVVFSLANSTPSLAAIAPNSSAAGTTLPVTLTGSNLTGATLNLSPGLTANNVVSSATQVTANLVIAVGAAIGPQSITVTTAGGTSNAVGFTINSPAAAPSSPAVSGATIWPNSATPATATNYEGIAAEVGVKFRSDSAGYVTAIRFYKGTLDTGTHTGQLWSSSGTLLGQGVFSGETASGWQQLNFATPVAIAANTTYVAAYHTTSGHFALDRNYFASSGADTGLLHALRSGVDGSNGVYLYSATPGFPSLSFGNTNYWVDVVFSMTTP